MKKIKKFYILLLIGLFLLPVVNYAIAKDIEAYVDVEADYQYIWEVDFDEDVYDEWVDDLDVDDDDDFLEYYDDIEAFKIEILGIDDEEDEYEYELALRDEENEYEGVEIEIDYYEAEYFDSEDTENVDWVLKGSEDDYVIYEDDDELYMELSYNGRWFVASDIDWDDIVDKWETFFFENLIDGDAEELGDGVYVSMSFNDSKEIEVISRYNGDGVLKDYEYIYDHETLVEIELEKIERITETPDYTILIVLILAGILIVGVVLIVVVLIIITNKNKVKQKKETISMEWKEEKIETKQPEEVLSKTMYCPFCGVRVSIDAIFCNECGTNLKK